MSLCFAVVFGEFNETQLDLTLSLYYSVVSMLSLTLTLHTTHTHTHKHRLNFDEFSPQNVDVTLLYSIGKQAYLGDDVSTQKSTSRDNQPSMRIYTHPTSSLQGSRL